MRKRSEMKDVSLLLADLVLKGDVDKKGLDCCDLEYLLNVAKTNGVLFFLVEFLRENNIFDVEGMKVLEEVFENQCCLLSEMLSVTSELIHIFEGEGIHLLPIKSFLQYPYVDDDLDIVVVEQERIPDCHAILLKNEYRYFKSRSSLREPKKRFYFPPYSGLHGGEALRIHLHYAISWNGVDYLDIREVWKRHRYMNVRNFDIPIPSVEDELLIMAAHAVYENRYVLLGDLLQLKLLLESKDVDWDYILGSAKEYNWNVGLHLFLCVASNLMKRFSEEELVPQRVLHELSNEIRGMPFGDKCSHLQNFSPDNLSFPFVLPFLYTSAVFFHKLSKDIRVKKVKELIREFAAYTIVDWLVFYRFKKGIKELRKVKNFQ